MVMLIAFDRGNEKYYTFTMQHTVLSRKNLARLCQIMLSAPSQGFKKGNV